MSQDLRNLFEKEREKTYSLPEGHEERFKALLDQKLPERKNRGGIYMWIAASIVLLLALVVGVKNYVQSPLDPTNEQVVSDTPKSEENGLTLGDLSPDLKKVEQYYTANINLELAQLDISEENKGVVDEFMTQLADLDTEYKSLNKELNELGPNDQTITALIKNLQIRLQLLLKLKSKLNELKSSKNETVTKQSA